MRGFFSFWRRQHLFLARLLTPAAPTTTDKTPLFAHISLQTELAWATSMRNLFASNCKQILLFSLLFIQRNICSFAHFPLKIGVASSIKNSTDLSVLFFIEGGNFLLFQPFCSVCDKHKRHVFLKKYPKTSNLLPKLAFNISAILSNTRFVVSHSFLNLF